MTDLVERRSSACGASRTGPRDRLPGVVAVAIVAAVALGVAELGSSLSPLVVGVLLGALIANVVTIPEALAPGIGFCARSVLRFGIVLLGLRLSLGDLADLGATGLLVVTCVVTVTFFGTIWLARWIGVGRDLGLLVATGYSICGASAIAAVDGVIAADEEETAYAITLVTLCGSLSIIVLPLIAEMVGLEGVDYGTWVGGAVHDVGQVVAAATAQGNVALEAATVVKLSRVVLLAPLVALISLSRRSELAARAAGTEGVRRPPVLPLFVVGFLAAIVLRSTGWLSDDVLSFAGDVEKVALTVALVALGAGVNVSKMRRLGGRPLALGLASWVLVAGAAYAGTTLVS